MAESAPTPLFPLAVIIPIAAGLIVLLDLPPLWWHMRNGNLSAACLIIYLVTLNFISFVNALVWPDDNFADWFDGRVFCDIQVRLHLFASFGIGACLICVFKNLADVLDTNKTVTSRTSDSRRRTMMLESLFCIGGPSIFILIYYVVQSQRYAILGISGCAYVWDGTWVGIVLCAMWFPLLHVIAGLLAALVMFRLVRYSRMFSSMLSKHSSTKSRFYRTFLMSLLISSCLVPASIYNFAKAFPLLGPYSWKYTHSDWEIIYMHPSDGHVTSDVWTCLVAGVMVFVFFGTGQEALKMYRGWLVSAGAGRIFPSLRGESLRSSTLSDDRWTLLEKKVRRMFGSTSSARSTDISRASTTSSVDPELALPPPVHVHSAWKS